MIITRTPFRISFFGGGTDYPAWYREHGGGVLSTSIDKYCYISCRSWPPFFEHRYRICYSKIELANALNEIQHPSVRACLGFVQHDNGLEITYNADLPARAGLGSSSSFTVGLLNALYGLKGEVVSKQKLSEMAIHIEQDVIGESVGSQDQVATSHGGFNLISFGGENEYRLRKLHISEARRQELESHLLLFYSGISRYSAQIAAQKIANIPSNSVQLKQMGAFVSEAANILLSDADIIGFGKLLHENWILKKSLSPQVSNDVLNSIYEKALMAGATGGKVLGAGGGGFVLIFARPELHGRIIEALSGYLHVPFSFDHSGTQIIFSSLDDSYDFKKGAAHRNEYVRKQSLCGHPC